MRIQRPPSIRLGVGRRPGCGWQVALAVGVGGWHTAELRAARRRSTFPSASHPHYYGRRSLMPPRRQTRPVGVRARWGWQRLRPSGGARRRSKLVDQDGASSHALTPASTPRAKGKRGGQPWGIKRMPSWVLGGSKQCSARPEQELAASAEVGEQTLEPFPPLATATSVAAMSVGAANGDNESEEGWRSSIVVLAAGYRRCYALIGPAVKAWYGGPLQ